MTVLQGSFRALAVDNEYRAPTLTKVGLRPNKPTAETNVGGTCTEYVCHADMINQQHSTRSVGLFPLLLTKISATATAQCAEDVYQAIPVPGKNKSQDSILFVLNVYPFHTSIKSNNL